MSSQEPRYLVFATDFSERTREARNWAHEIARRLGFEVLVVHAIETVHTEGDPKLRRWFAELQEEISERMESELSFFRKAQISAQGDIREGTAWRVVLDSAEERNAQLIVVGGHPLGEDAKGQVGTTSQKIALAANQPVLIVKSPDDGRVEASSPDGR